MLGVLPDEMTVLSPEDEGKFLMDAKAEQIGIVTEVAPEEQVAYVDPDPDVGDLLFGRYLGDDADLLGRCVHQELALVLG